MNPPFFFFFYFKKKKKGKVGKKKKKKNLGIQKAYQSEKKKVEFGIDFQENQDLKINRKKGSIGETKKNIENENGKKIVRISNHETKEIQCSKPPYFIPKNVLLALAPRCITVTDAPVANLAKCFVERLICHRPETSISEDLFKL